MLRQKAMTESERELRRCRFAIGFALLKRLTEISRFLLLNSEVANPDRT